MKKLRKPTNKYLPVYDSDFGDRANNIGEEWKGVGIFYKEQFYPADENGLVAGLEIPAGDWFELVSPKHPPIRNKSPFNASKLQITTIPKETIYDENIHNNSKK